MTALEKKNKREKKGWCDTMKLKILTRDEVAKAVNMAEAIETVKKAFIQLSTGKAEMPLRTQVPVERRRGVTLFMPAYLADSDAMGAKIVSVFPDNQKKKLPTIHAVVISVDAKTGRPTAVMDGTYLTALRTGAASGVATDILGREDARVAAIFGAGIQSRTQLEAICTVRSIEKVWVYDMVPAVATAYVKEMKERGSPVPADISVAKSPKQAVFEADVICTATTSFQPVFNDSDLKSGVHINGVGSYTPEMQEIPARTVIRSKVIVDSRQAALVEAGDLVIPIGDGQISDKHIHGEIGELVAGKIPGRESEEEMTFFKSVGLAVQDVSVAELVLRRASELGLGHDVEI
jgi:ornithine cyclodeaminase